MRKDAKVPITEVEATQAFEPRFNNGAHDLFSGCVLLERGADRLEVSGAHRLPHYFRIQAGFVFEVIIDGGNVRPRAFADLSDGGVMKTELGEHFSGRVD